MNTTLLTTIFGGVSAIGVAVATYLSTGFDPKNPIWWCGMVSAAALALKGYFSQGTPPAGQVVVTQAAPAPKA